jgi:hypothetical protein
MGGVSQVGDIVEGRYRLERRMGDGVFQAEDISLARKVVVRLSDPGGAEDLAWLATVLRSVQFATTYVAPVLDEGPTSDGGRYLVAPLIEGIPLDRLATARTPLGAERIASIGEGMLEAAQAARRVAPGVGAVPASAILDRDNQIRVTRFTRGGRSEEDVALAVAVWLHRLAAGVDPEPGVPVATHRDVPAELADVIDAALAGDVHRIEKMRHRLALARRRLVRG